MDDIVGKKSEARFANGQSSRELRASSGNLHDRTDSSDPLEAFRFPLANRRLAALVSRFIRTLSA